MPPVKIIAIELGTEVDYRPKISEKTESNIHSLIQKLKNEQGSEEDVDQDQTADLLQQLIKSGETGICIKDIINENESIFSKISKLNKIIKERGGLWILKKKRRNGKTYYYCVPS